MSWIEISFWVLFGIVFYAFPGYDIILYVMVCIKRLAGGVVRNTATNFEPEVTLVVPCFNEAGLLADKIANCRQLDYPADKLNIVFITDGSADNSGLDLKAWPGIKVLHENRTATKTAAKNRAMKFVKTLVVIFSDADAMLNSGAVKNIVKHFADDKVGCVSGEKRIVNDAADKATAVGEGLYWKYGSLIKRLDSELNCAVGATGGLVAFRTGLYKDLPEDTLLEDFMQSMQMAVAGYKIVYEPEAYAVETASASVAEELNHKIRICAGSWQSINRLSGKFIIRKTPLLFFQYISNRVLAWTITPFLLIAMFFLNFKLGAEGNEFYQLLMFSQILFYSAAMVGFRLKYIKPEFKHLFIPFYFCMMNYAVLEGLLRYLSGRQKATWNKPQPKVVALN